jgi:hypothetical protein
MLKVLSFWEKNETFLCGVMFHDVPEFLTDLAVDRRPLISGRYSAEERGRGVGSRAGTWAFHLAWSGMGRACWRSGWSMLRWCLVKLVGRRDGGHRIGRPCGLYLVGLTGGLACRLGRLRFFDSWLWRFG